MAETFDGDWLALRERFDAAARSRNLARLLAATLPARPRLLDLGAGTGSLFRWLAPILAGPQSWTLADADPTLLHRAFTDIADWAKARGLAMSHATGPVLLVHAPAGDWRVQALLTDLAAPPRMLPFRRHDAVLCSALLDLVSADWVAAFTAELRQPLLACLSVTGRDAMWPAHPFDRVVRATFRDDQGRDKGFGPALGPRAPTALQAALRTHGFRVKNEASDWRIPPEAGDMLTALIAGHAAVAGRRLPARRTAIRAWAALRTRQIDKMRLAMRIGHRDILALPPKPVPNSP